MHWMPPCGSSRLVISSAFTRSEINLVAPTSPIVDDAEKHIRMDER
ncbi:hypothetical protein O9992_21960 [Vibrio lentus]|nr:hypothetical protein [Vibrio lentus]